MDRRILIAVMQLAEINSGRLGRILERPSRTVQSWLSRDGDSHRNIPKGEIERLCFIIDPSGTRPDLIGWIVVAARGRWNLSYRENARPLSGSWSLNDEDWAELKYHTDKANLPWS
jgi:hypothetical protein